MVPLPAITDIDGRRYLTMSCGHCAQLTATGDGRLVCGIYEVRPEACRAFRAGSFECLKSRQHRGAMAAALREGGRRGAPAATPGAAAVGEAAPIPLPDGLKIHA